jgi:aminopeptidase N
LILYRLDKTIHENEKVAFFLILFKSQTSINSFNMKNSLFYFLSFSFFCFHSFSRAQTKPLTIEDENIGSCAHMHAIRSKNKSVQKSNTLSISDIERSEKYDMHYVKLDLEMSYLNTSISGSGVISATALEPVDSALFELFSTYNITDITVDGSSTGYTRTGTKLLVPVNKMTGENFEIEVFYDGIPPNAATNPLGGAGITNASSPSWGNQVTWSLSEPFSAMEWFPIKQSLIDKIDSTETWFTVPIESKAGSNGVLQQITPISSSTHRFEWKSNYLIDYYLISVSIAKYVDYTITANPAGSGPVSIQNYIYDNPSTLPNFQTRIDETIDFIEFFADIFGPYPFANEKYGHCMAPLGGGMEHQTMTTQGFFEKSLTAHELAHQWFGDHVTCSSWSDIWVNEGFASYAEYLMLAELYPGDELGDMDDRHSNIMSQPGGSTWCADSLNDGSIFSSRLTYDKGAAIIHTLRFLIGNDVQFFQILKDFQNQYGFKTAKAIDFIEIAESVTGKNFSEFMEQWYFGEGYPTYSVVWNNPGSNVIVEINHATSKPSTTPLFTNELELRFDRATLPDTIIRFEIASNATQIEFPNIGQIINCTAIDPNNWIINGNGAITKNTNLLSISENQSSSNVFISPNPTNDFTTVKMANEGQYSLDIIGIDGKHLRTLLFTKISTVDLRNEPSGTYVFVVSDLLSNEKIHRIVKK